jgi:hypothetical protein
MLLVHTIKFSQRLNSIKPPGLQQRRADQQGFLSFRRGLKSGLCNQEKVAGWMCLRIRCLEEHFCVGHTIRKKAGQNPTIKCAIICTPRKILLVLLH